MCFILDWDKFLPSHGFKGFNLYYGFLQNKHHPPPPKAHFFQILKEAECGETKFSFFPCIVSYDMHKIIAKKRHVLREDTHKKTTFFLCVSSLRKQNWEL